MNLLKLTKSKVLIGGVLSSISYFGYQYYQKRNQFENYYQKINKEWLENTTIPEKYSQYSNFHILHEENQKRTLDLAISDDGLIGDLYKRLYYLFASEARFITSIQTKEALWNHNDNPSKYVARACQNIDKIKDKNELIDTIIDLSTIEDIDIFFKIKMEKDAKGELVIPHLSQSGLTFPDKKYYQTDNENESEANSKKIVQKEAFKKYIRTLFKENYNIPLENQMDEEIYKFEKEYSETFLDAEDYNNPEITYNKVSSPEFLKKLNFENVILDNKDIFSIINDKINKYQLDFWKTFLKYKLIDNYSGFAHQKIRDAHFEFYNKTILGQKAEKKEHEKALDVIDTLIPDEMGKKFAEKYYSSQTNHLITTISNLIKSQFVQMIDGSNLLSGETKKKAIEKIETIKLELGKPEKMIDYSDFYNKILEVNEKSDQYDKPTMIEVVKIYSEWKWNYNLEKINKLHDDKLWGMPSHMVNAYYDLDNNKIVFPAGILQEPFISKDKSFAHNLGSIGMIIAHEISHSLDSQGRKYNKDGKLEDWWLPEECQTFDSKAEKFDKMFSECLVQGKNLNGKLTLGENIADTIGLQLVTDILYMIDSNYQSQNWKDLFESFGMIFRAQRTPEFEIMLLNLDPHSPPEYRTNLPLSNNNHFYNVYNIDENHKMWIDPEERLSIW